MYRLLEPKLTRRPVSLLPVLPRTYSSLPFSLLFEEQSARAHTLLLATAQALTSSHGA